jgi:cytosine/adenosine deaminase-related metal-dependent hydrolase
LEYLLRGAQLLSGRPGAVRVRGGRIDEMADDLRRRPGERVVDLQGMVLLPGLINAHDHLHLDLFPRLGSPPYRNSYEWLDDITWRRPEAAVAAGRVSASDRFLWGAYRNLLSGVTTVAHHGPMPLRYLLGAELPIRLRLPIAWAESLRDGPDVAGRARRARGRMPFAIHLADGVDEVARRELDIFDELGGLGPGTLAVHGVGLDQRQRRRLAESGTALVWCPSTSQFLFGATAATDDLPLVALGTDSTMTGTATLLDEIRVAASVSPRPPSPARILSMVTSEAARAIQWPELGRLRPGVPADLVAFPPATDAAEALLRARPESLALVMVGGRIRLVARALDRRVAPDLEAATMAGVTRGVAPGFGALTDRIRRALPAWYDSPARRLME